MKIVFLDGATLSLHKDLDLKAIFNKYGETVVYESTDYSEVAKRIKDADAVFLNKTKFDKSCIKDAKNLKYIGVLATGYNMIKDIEYLQDKDIVITNAPGYSTNGVAELTFSFILEFAKKVLKHDKEIKMGNWQKSKSFTLYQNGIFELYNKTIGIIGYGNIGKKVAKIAMAFDMNVLIHTRTPKKEDETPNLKFVSFEHILKNADILTLHCPLTEKTRGLINKEALNKMNGSILINTARGPIVDEQAVSDALLSGKLLGFGSDVASKEPILADNPLLKAKNCILTPHIAWANYETRVRLLNIVEDNFKSFLKGNPINRVKV